VGNLIQITDLTVGLPKAAGQFVEFGPAKLVLERPEAGYTRELLAAVPEIPRSGEV
jgi:ABC-type dipeptide/oligopeptide/nickel transport system ATPase component